MHSNQKEFELNSNNLVIYDGKKAVALAGIMGGLNSEINDGTTEVMFESENLQEIISERALVRWDRLMIRVHFTQRV